MANIRKEMKCSSNDAVREMAAIIEHRANQIESKYQRDTVIDYAFFGLWLMLHDTAYRDVGFAIFDDILKVAKDLRKMIRQFVKPPYLWYPNVWVFGKKLSKKQREEHRIPDYEHSVIERQCVPAKHRADLAKTLRKMQKGD